jgi:serine/threonine-protein kinase
VSDLAGRVLAGRYMLHGAIGTGASGRVYVAEDTRLRRRVAVKVLHAALAEDSAFLRRFRAEAQLAASLHHPHIVTVHDWGEDDVPFMVLELLEGGSLRGMLDNGTLLSVAQTARVARDVASALDYAHARGVLHRDIKPANLLFDEHGRVRVADFGLARALAEASWTEPAGAVFGTARYASPEQATGSQLDARSDLYSLALVTVEAVTGRIPFAADTTIGTLTARTQRPIVAPPELGPLAPVVDRAGAIDPADRYPDAATMRQAFADAADALPPPSPLLLAGMIDRVDPNPTRAVPSRSAALFDQDAADVVVERAPVEATLTIETDKRQDTGGQRRLVPMVVGIVLLVTVALAAAALAQVRSAKPIKIPGFEGVTLARAQEIATSAGLELKTGPARNSPEPPNTVIDQDPGPGEFTTGRTVTVVLSAGPAKVPVPDILGRPWEAAKKALDAAGLLYDDPPAKQFDDKAPLDTVLSVDPEPPATLLPDAKVKVTISAGHAPVKIADVEGASFADAQRTLTGQKFKVERASEREFSSTVDEGGVVRTEPAIGDEAPYGSTVTVYLSKGPDLVTVPTLVNLSFDDAKAELEARGLFIQTEGRVKGRVTGQSPRPGARIERNSDVVVSFGRCILIFCLD